MKINNQYQQNWDRETNQARQNKTITSSKHSSDKEIEATDRLIAEIEARYDYIHTCINSEY